MKKKLLSFLIACSLFAGFGCIVPCDAASHHQKKHTGHHKTVKKSQHRAGVKNAAHRKSRYDIKEEGYRGETARQRNASRYTTKRSGKNYDTRSQYRPKKDNDTKKKNTQKNRHTKSSHNRHNSRR